MELRRTIAIGLLTVFGVLGVHEVASADWSFRFGFGHGGSFFDTGYHHHGGYRRHHRRARRRARRARHVRRVWVAPVYREVIVGYNHCGHPVYRSICVREGYYRTVSLCH